MKRILDQVEQATGNPGVVHLKLHDQQTIRSQQFFYALKGLARVNVIVDSNVGEMGSRSM